jgi:hypothetical protein
MKTILIVLALASILFGKDSVAVNVASSNGILQTKILSYDADQLLLSWQYNPAIGAIYPQIPNEMMQYVVRDTAIKNMPPFMGGNLTISRKDLGKDTTILDTLTKHINAKVKAKILVK